ncbi:hypothetical protein Nepgr_017996 [Nepenthes gracilis]|uniref:Uncharacterized protein n=1 Tax=Nepenthes gracilis TaxID=150966 RepID=A0AAD3XTX5_NEPGR|nr:hypothetical protein Nepgr_017996 [Nepenthes gracilis]
MGVDCTWKLPVEVSILAPVFTLNQDADAGRRRVPCSVSKVCLMNVDDLLRLSWGFLPDDALGRVGSSAGICVFFESGVAGLSSAEPALEILGVALGLPDYGSVNTLKAVAAGLLEAAAGPGRKNLAAVYS